MRTCRSEYAINQALAGQAASRKPQAKPAPVIKPAADLAGLAVIGAGALSLVAVLSFAVYVLSTCH